MTNPTDHELNAVLARVAGVEIWLDEWNIVWLYRKLMKDGCHVNLIWDPLHDANQMEMVEEALKAQGWEMIVGWTKSVGRYWAELRNIPKAFWQNDADKKRAFALAVYGMAQARDNHVPSH